MANLLDDWTAGCFSAGQGGMTIPTEPWFARSHFLPAHLELKLPVKTVSPGNVAFWHKTDLPAPVASFCF